ncbi:hypothetical protein BNATCHR187 (nucleomorph) [Bigelowiella natans]|uniref:Uncharacterized protein n=1 Tax=Bigelowiella natans TaxID=227086 RepID=Q3LWL3_BIGNA|nr:hypothetical protein BNATCHR187 [Bigelowiella natans]ABA27153.1 hypothetical protein [Bigelowiella natans]
MLTHQIFLEKIFKILIKKLKKNKKISAIKKPYEKSLYRLKEKKKIIQTLLITHGYMMENPHLISPVASFLSVSDKYTNKNMLKKNFISHFQRNVIKKRF